MAHLNDLFTPDELQAALDNRHVTARPSRTVPGVTVYNYSPEAAYERAWNRVTLNCRGLITTGEGEIVGRGFRKFFNFQEHAAGDLDLDSPVTAMDKLDGSLGIIYRTDDGYRVATRGSADSDQALHATRILQTRYAGFTPDAGVTPLVEIIFPANRIVLDYGDFDDLVLLGGVDNLTGQWVHPDRITNWDGPRTELLHDGDVQLRDVPNLPDRDNREGLVVHVEGNQQLVKFKQADYVELHRTVTNFTPRQVWEAMVDGRLDTYLPALPDELYKEADRIAAELKEQLDQQKAEYQRHAAELEAMRDHGASRKDLALRVKTAAPSEWAPLLMSGVVAGYDVTPKLVARIRPAASGLNQG